MNAFAIAMLVGTTSLALSALPGAAQNETPLAAPGAAATPNPSTLLSTAAPMSPADVDRVFLVAAAQGTNAELEMAELAVKRGHADEVLGFAETMLTDHSALEKRFRNLKPGMLPTHPPEGDVDRLALVRLAHTPPADFDQQYLVQQVGDHLATISLFTTEAKEGGDPALRSFASSELSMLRSHLQLAVADTGRIGGDTPFSQH